MKTKNELCKWLRDNAAWGNSAWAVVNGGGISLISPGDIEGFISDIMSDDYADEVIILQKGEEYADFKSMSPKEYDGTDCFIKVEHLSGYNQENMDIQVQYWHG